MMGFDKTGSLKANYFIESDGSVTATLNGFDLVINAIDKSTADIELAKELLDYAEDYFSDFQLYYSSVNRKNHFPYILRVLLSKDIDEIKDLFG